MNWYQMKARFRSTVLQRIGLPTQPEFRFRGAPGQLMGIGSFVIVISHLNEAFLYKESIMSEDFILVPN